VTLVESFTQKQGLIVPKDEDDIPLCRLEFFIFNATVLQPVYAILAKLFFLVCIAVNVVMLPIQSTENVIIGKSASFMRSVIIFRVAIPTQMAAAVTRNTLL
jgi:magnesium-transporting ATPase (P-type)